MKNQEQISAEIEEAARQLWGAPDPPEDLIEGIRQLCAEVEADLEEASRLREASIKRSH